MKVKYSLIGVVILMLVISGVVFSIGNGGEQNENAQENDQDEAVLEEVSYEVIEDLANLPQEIKETVELLKTKRGYFIFNQPAFETGEGSYIMISSGEKPTGGYDIYVESIKKENENLEIMIKETEPGEDEMVTQALTYPHIILRLEATYETIEITNTEDESLTDLASVEIEAPEIEREADLEPIAPSDPQAGESFLEGELLEIDLENNVITLEVHKGPNTPDVGPEVKLQEEVQIRRLEELEEKGNGQRIQRESAMEMQALEPGMIVGLILTPEEAARAVIVHAY